MVFKIPQSLEFSFRKQYYALWSSSDMSMLADLQTDIEQIHLYDT